MNKEGRGIRSAFGTCWCDDEMQCTCGTTFRNKGPTIGSANKELIKHRKDNMSNKSDLRSRLGGRLSDGNEDDNEHPHQKRSGNNSIDDMDYFIFSTLTDIVPYHGEIWLVEVPPNI